MLSLFTNSSQSKECYLNLISSDITGLNLARSNCRSKIELTSFNMRCLMAITSLLLIMIKMLQSIVRFSKNLKLEMSTLSSNEELKLKTFTLQIFPTSLNNSLSISLIEIECKSIILFSRSF